MLIGIAIAGALSEWIGVGPIPVFVAVAATTAFASRLTLGSGRPPVLLLLLWSVGIIANFAYGFELAFEFGLADDLLLTVAITGSAALSAGVCAVRARSAHWIVLAVGIFAYGVSAVWYFVEPEVGARFPSAADLGFFLFYASVLIAACLLLREVLPRSPLAWIDTAIGGLSFAAVADWLLLRPHADDVPGALAVSEHVYALADFLLLGLIVTACALTRWRAGRALILFALGVLSLAIADTGYIFDLAHGAFAPDALTMLSWYAGLLALAWAPWQRRDVGIPMSTAGDRANVPVIASLCVLPLVVTAHTNGPAAEVVNLAGAAIVLLLAGFRLWLTLRENRRLLGLTRAEAARIYAILASTGDAIIGTDGDGRITFVNGAVITLTRRPEALLQGILVSDLVTDPRVATDLDATLRDGAQRVGEAVSELGGRDVTIEYKSMPIEMGGVVTGAVVSLTDVTEARIADAALRQSEAHLAEAQRLAGIGSWRYDMADGVLHTSAEMSNLLGHDMSGAVYDAERMLEVVHPEDRSKLQAGLERCITSDGPQGLDYRVEVDGELRMIHLQVECQRADDGTPVAIVGTCLNVTDRMHRHEAERANEAKSAFLSRVSHELRTPLNSILGFGQLLQMDALDSRQSQHVDHILKAGGHLLALIDEVLQISTVESGATSMSNGPVGVAGVAGEVAELLSPLAAREGVEVFVDPSCTGPVVVADPQRFHQVLVNLVSNAIKYNRPGGIVRIATDMSGGTATIAVTDSGQGIAADLLPRLFRPFDRLGREGDTAEGTGLGLSVAKALVEAMDGAISVESTLGEGSRFAVRLPVAASRQAAIAHA